MMRYGILHACILYHIWRIIGEGSTGTTALRPKERLGTKGREKAMAFDFKKEERALYQPKATPAIVSVGPMRFVCVSGTGDPNEEGGAYAQAVGALYAVSYAIKMSKRGDHAIEGYFDYVVPPLEGLWWQEGVSGIDYAHKESFSWTSLIRVPDFVGEAELAWAKEEVMRKKKADASAVGLCNIEEGLCVQCMHIGPYDTEPETVLRMHEFAEAQGYALDITDVRRHHEIYLSDPRRVAPERTKTVVRHPIRPL